MSLSGTTQTYIPNTLDGLNVLEADQIYIDGELVNLDNFVPYTGANKTVNLGSQNIQTTHTPTVGSDVVNLTTLTAAVAFVDGATALTYLNKITSTPQTVVADTTFNSSVTSAGYYTDTAGYNFARPNASYNAWGITRIANGGQIRDLQFKDDTAGVDCLLLSNTGQTVYVGLTCNYATGSKIPIFNADRKLVSSGVDSVKITYLDNVNSDIQVSLNGKASLTGGNSFSGLQNYSDKTSDTVAIFDGSKNLSSSVISTTELNYLGGLTGNIQTQLNGKLSLLGGSMNGNISMGFNNISSLYTPVNANDVVNKGYVDSAIGGAGALYLLKSGGTMVGDILMGANKVTSTATPTTNDTLTRKGYVDTQDALRLALTGGTLTGTVLNSAGDFHPYRGGDTNRGCILFANNQDGASYSNFNGGLASWYGIGFKSTLDSITRFMFDTRSGDSSQVGSITCAGLTSSGAITVDATVNVGTRLLGTPDGVSSGNFWLGLRGTGTELQRLAISINGPSTTGIVSHVAIAKLLYLSAYTANRALFLDGSQAVQSSSTTGTELGYLSGVTSGLQGQIDAKAPYTYVDSQNNSQNTVIATKADITYVNTQDAGLQGQINTITTNIPAFPRRGDLRTGAKPNNQGADSLSFYFGKYSNNGTGNFADLIIMNSWADGSGGDTNMIAYNKATSGIRQYQGTYGSASVFSTWYDCVMTDANSGNVGIAGQVNIGVSGNTVPNLKLTNNTNHITGNAAEAYLFNGQNGYIAVGRNTTRSATEANLHMGTAGTDASIESIASNGSVYLPLSFYASSHYFTGGFVGVGNPTLNAYRAPLGKLTVNSNYSGGDTAGFCVNAYDGSEYNMRLFPYVQAGGQVAYQFKIYNQGVAYNSLSLGYNGSVGIGTTIPAALLDIYSTTADYTNSFQVRTPWASISLDGTQIGSGRAWTLLHGGPGAGVGVGNFGIYDETANAYRFAIGSSGNVGIGSELPAYRLDVNGNIRAVGSLLFGNTGVYEAGCIFSNSDWGCLFRAKQNAPAQAHFNWRTSDGTDLMRISPSGVLSFYGGATAYSIPNGLSTTAGALVIGGISVNYNDGWNAGLLMECSEQTGITINDSGERLASFMYYNTNNRFEMGKNAGGYGTTPIDIQGDLYLTGTALTPATTSPEFQLSRDPFTDKCIWTPKKYVKIYETLNVPKYVNWNGASLINALSLNVASNILFQGFFTFFTDVGGQRYAYARLYHAATNTYYYPEATKYFNITGNHEVVPINQFFYNLPSGNYDLYMFGGSSVLVDGNDRAVFSAIVFS